MVFMIVYIFLHLMTFGLILLALIMIFHLSNMQTLNEGMPRVLTLQNICSKMSLSMFFYNYLLIFALGDL